MLLNLQLVYFCVFLLLKLGKMMDIITPNQLIYRDFNRYTYGTEIMSTLLVNKQDICENNEFTFCIADMQKMFKKNINYKRFYQTILQLKNNDVKINDSTFSIFNRVDLPKNGIITVEIHPMVKDYFSKLKKNFTNYHLYSLVCLSSPTSKKLYLLMSHWRKIGKIVNEKESYYRIKIEKIRELLYVTDLYSGFHNFNKFLQKQILEINEKTDFFCTFTSEKKGKKYNTYNVYIQQNQIVKEKINHCFGDNQDLKSTKNTVKELKTELKHGEPEIKHYYLNSFELQAFREKLSYIPDLRRKMADDITTKIQINGFTSINNFERWLLRLEDIARSKSKIQNPAAYVVKSLYQNNG